MTIKIFIPGTPQGKGRARSFLRNGKVGHYTPEKTRTYEGFITSLAMDAMGTRKPLEVPINILICAYFEIPKSWPKWKVELAEQGKILPTTKPDMDNIKKAVNDGLNGVVWKDDCYVVEAKTYKKFALGVQKVGVEICVLPVGKMYAGVDGITMAEIYFPAQIKNKVSA